MSENSKDLRELLIELEYGELDELDHVEAQRRIDADPQMAAMQSAFGAVRAEMRADAERVPAEARPSRIAFVAMPGRRAASWNPLAKLAAVAASFVFGIALAAAFANGTGSWQATPSQQRPATGSVPSSTGSVADSDSVAPVADLSPELVEFLDQRYGQVPETIAISDMDRAQLQPILDDLMATREASLRQVMRQMMASANEQQRQEIETMMVGMFQTFDTQRQSDLLTMADQFGILQQNTGLELQRTSDAIDYLFTRVGTGREERNQ